MALRAVLVGRLYIVATGWQRRALPHDFPPRSTVQGYHDRWRDGRVWQRLVDRLADRVCRGEQLGRAVAPPGPWTIEIVQRPAGTKSFQLLPRRRVVERTFAWLGRYRRLARDFEGSIDSAPARILVAHLGLFSRRIARQKLEL